MPAPKRFTVLWAPVAKSDLFGIVGRVAEESPESAELREHGMELYRELICRPWRIIYRITDRRVWVSAVVDGRRNLEDLLLERFLQ